MTLPGLKQFFFRSGRYLLLITFIFVIYSPVIGKKTFSPDAHTILKPLLDIETPQSYLEMLSSFQVTDFQPVRDLTFFIDLFFFRYLNVNTFAFTNILLWCGSCLFLMFLLKRYKLENWKSSLLIMAFSAYPIFSQAVVWTMARKHVLALFLILWTTSLFLDWIENKRSWLFPYLIYVAAGLSHPIILFWPCWALLYFILTNSEKNSSEIKKVFGIFFITMVTLLLTNYAYYTVLNDHAREYYGQAAPVLTFTKLFLNLGFYFRQIVWPYELSFVYYPDLTKAFIGFLVIAALGILTWKSGKNRIAVSWMAFSLLPFPVIIGLSVYDQYLLLTGTGIIMSLSLMITRLNKYAAVPLIVLTCFWGYFTNQQAALWVQPGKTSERNFRNAPSCRSAVESANISSVTEEKPSSEVLNYLKVENCFTVAGKMPPLERPKIVVVRALYLYFEEDSASIENRMAELKTLAKFHYYPALVYAIALSQEGKLDEVKQVTEYILERTKGPVEDTGPLIQKQLRPYCERNKLSACLKITAEKHKLALPYL